jgi:hypothetical protein
MDIQLALGTVFIFSYCGGLLVAYWFLEDRPVVAYLTYMLVAIIWLVVGGLV